MKNFDLAKLLFRVSCAVFVFALGFVLSAYRLFPYSVIRDGANAVKQVLSERETLAGVRPKDLTRVARHPGTGVTVNKPGTQPGLTVIGSFFRDGDNEMRLVRMDGSVVNRWPVRFFDVFRNPEHVDSAFLPQREWQVHTHGLVTLSDGSIVFNFEGGGAVQLDRCGKVVWSLPRMTHHSVELSQEGGFWIPVRDMVRNNSPFPLLKPTYIHDLILKVSPSGKVVDEISVIDILLKNELGAFLFTNGLPGVQLTTARGYGADPTHLNDVEELTREMAPAFPQFKAGDLLVSLRNINMVLVVDPVTKKVKWHQVGPWLKQHDPDFLPSGRISVFSNNDDGTPTGSILGGSQIVEVDPRTGKTATRYGGTPEQHWFSSFRGRHQYLENGNVLITDSESGRVIEVTPQHEILWQYLNRYDDQYVAIMRDALRYPENYFTIKDWTCHAP